MNFEITTQPTDHWGGSMRRGGLPRRADSEPSASRPPTYSLRLSWPWNAVITLNYTTNAITSTKISPLVICARHVLQITLETAWKVSQVNTHLTGLLPANELQGHWAAEPTVCPVMGRNNSNSSFGNHSGEIMLVVYVHYFYMFFFLWMLVVS